jgi:predicted HAD superfamily Cof-like phosphohydrolase
MTTAYEVAKQMAYDCKDGDRRYMILTALGGSRGQYVSPQIQINALHDLMDTPNPGVPTVLSPADRYRRLHYILSEFIETVNAAGFDLFAATGNRPLDKTTLELHIKTGNPLADTVEVLDGLADIMVVCLGMASEMGYDLMPIFDEVIAASVTKLQPDGFIKKNECLELKCPNFMKGCENPEHFEIPDEPAGKWIKGPNYCPPQIAVVLGEQE